MVKFITQSFVIICLFFCIHDCLATTMVQLPQWQQVSMGEKYSFRGSAVIGQSLWITGSNNSVFVSQDGGKTWNNKSVKNENVTDFRDIVLFDSKTAIIMGVGSGEESILYKTTDGGNSWQQLYQNDDEQGFFDSIAFWNEKQGLLLGDPVDGYYVVKVTDDGGQTWRRISKQALPTMLEKEAAFAASGNTLIVGKHGEAWLTTGGFSASVYHSVDFGENWQRFEVPIYNETQTAGGYGLALNHLGQVFVLGGDYLQRNVRYTNMATYVDGSWSVVNSGNHGLRTAMSCMGNICIATGKTGNDISYNAGKIWHKLANRNNKDLEQGFYTISNDETIFLAAGEKGKIGIFNFQSR